MPSKMPEQKYVSRQNLLEKHPRVFNLIITFGPACVCLIPSDIRGGNKTPGKKKSFPGAIARVMVSSATGRVYLDARSCLAAR